MTTIYVVSMDLSGRGVEQPEVLVVEWERRVALEVSGLGEDLAINIGVQPAKAAPTHDMAGGAQNSDAA